MMNVVKMRSIVISFLLAIVFAVGILSVAHAEEQDPISKSDDGISAQAAVGDLAIWNFAKTNIDECRSPDGSVIGLNEGMLKVRLVEVVSTDGNGNITKVREISSDDIAWKSSNSSLLKVEYGKAAGYSNNGVCALIPTGSPSPISGNPKDPENCTISATYRGQTVDIRIGVKKVDINTYKVSPIPACSYEGKPCTPALTITGNVYTVTAGQVQQSLGQLKEGRDYTVEYRNNDKIGQATAIVTGINSYWGTMSIPFTIKAASPKPSTPSGNGSSDSSGSQSGIASDAGATTVTPQAKPNAPTVTGTWKKSGGKWWFSYDTATKKAQGNKSWPSNQWVTIKGKLYHFNGSGYMNSGWLKSGSTWYYLGSDGAMKTGWQKVKGKWYYLASDGKMQTGKKLIGNKIYFLNASTGAMKTGWNQESTGWYYYTGSGVMKTGWQKVKGKWYYLDPSNGRMKTGFYNVGNSRYYSNGSGVMQTGWKKISNKWYHFKGSGAMSKGWAKVGGKWYYLNPSDGIMKTGFYDVNGKRYYSKASGVMQTGWKKISNKWYYFAGSGAMQKNKWISGKYWVDANGVMATSSWVDGNKYYVDKNGKWVKGKTRA